MPINIIDRYIIRELSKIFLISVGSLTVVLYLDKFLFITENIVNDQITENSKNEFQKSINKQIVTEIAKAKEFFLAEEYHQCFIQKKFNHE